FLIFDTPGFQVCSNSEGSDNSFSFIFQFIDTGVIQVVVVIMGEHEQIQRRNIFSIIMICPRKSFSEEAKRRSITAKHRIHKNLETIHLQKIRRMAKPDQSWSVAINFF